MVRCRLTNFIGMQIKKISDEFIGMLRHYVVTPELLNREILQVEGKNQARATVNGCSQHVSIVRIRQFDGCDQMLKSGDQAISNVGVHQRARVMQLLSLQVWSLL